MKILKNIAIGLCMLFTIYSLGGQFLVWSGFMDFFSAPATKTTNGGILSGMLIFGIFCFVSGYDIARAKYEEKLREVQGRDY
jgi:hypothetical protein